MNTQAERDKRARVIVEAFAAGKTPIQIAREFGFKIHSVRMILWRRGVVIRKPLPPSGISKKDGIRKPERDGKRLPVVEQGTAVWIAAITLGDRLREERGSFWLDEAPACLNEVMRATNRIRERDGLPQVTNNPNWRTE